MLNMGIVGCGYWGPNLVRNFSSIKDCNVIKLCDVDTERIGSMASLYPQIELTTEYKELIEDTKINAIVIATPVRFHFEMAMQSLLADKHTFVEKPMVSNVGKDNF